MENREYFHEDANYHKNELFIRKDGTRTWHQRFAAVESPENGGRGACVWIGSLPDREVVTRKIPYDSKNPFPFGTVFSNLDLIAEYYQSTPNFNEHDPVHTYVPCGNRWIGVAAYPLPEDYGKPLSVWPGWTHLMHIPDSKPILSAFIKDSFDFIHRRIKEEGYPQDHRHLTQELIDYLATLSMSRSYMENSPAAFPWVSNELVQPKFE